MTRSDRIVEWAKRQPSGRVFTTRDVAMETGMGLPGDRIVIGKVSELVGKIAKYGYFEKLNTEEKTLSVTGQTVRWNQWRVL